MCTLPMDIIFSRILPKLPVKSLLRFKCVSKSFNTEISSPEFIKIQHLHTMSCDDNRLLIVPEFENNEGIVKRWFHIVCDLETPSDSPSICHYPKTLDFSEVGCEVVASCECYLLIRDGFLDNYDLKLLNPATCTYRGLPYVDVTFSNTHARFGICHCVDDEFNDDYKVVRLDEGYYDDLEVKVYSLRNNSWKTVECNLISETCLSDCDCALVLVQNHLLHLIFFDQETHVMTRIGCFDIKAEQWVNDVPLPDILTSENSLKYTQKLYFYIASLDGKLCFTSPDGQCSTYDLWVMKEYGVKESWVKLMSLSIPNGLREDRRLREIAYVPVAYRKGSPQEVLCRRETGEWFWYNLRDKDIIEADELAWSNRTSYNSYLCKESLLNFPGSKPIPVSQKRKRAEEDDFRKLQHYMSCAFNQLSLPYCFETGFGGRI